MRDRGACPRAGSEASVDAGRHLVRPKSSSFGVPSLQKPMLLGLMSRCSQPRSCRTASASATEEPSPSASASGSGPDDSRVASVPPARYSVTRTGVPRHSSSP